MMNVKLRNHKGLRLAKLESLEQFNVICGRNNSGKTTVLEALAKEDTCSLGISIPESQVDRLAPMAAAGMGWGTTDQSTSENIAFKRILKDFLHSKASDVLYAGDIDALVAELRDRMNTSALRNWAFSEPSVRNAFKSCFPVFPLVVYVPAQRSLDVQVVVNGAQQPNNNGVGITNYLFRAKNLPTSSDEYRCWKRIVDAFSQISGGSRFEIFMPESSNLRLNFADPGRDWIPAEACGLGLHDLLVILTHSLLPGRGLVIIEEPETHMHPDLQRRLAIFLKSLTAVQFILSTHSNVYLNSAIVDRVYMVSYDTEVRVADATSRALALDALGYQVSDNLLSDTVVLMEGPSDRRALEQLLIRMGVMQKKSVKFWPLGGDIMDKLDLDVLAQGSKLIAVVDRDPGSSVVRERFLANCAARSIPVHRLERYSIENYFPIETYRKVFGAQVPTEMTVVAPDVKVESQLGFSPKKKLWNLASAADIDAIGLTDLGELLRQIAQMSGD